MASSVGDLVINVSTDLVSLYTGLAQAADIVSKTASQLADQFSGVESSVSSLTSAIKGVAAAAGVGLSIAGIASFAESATEAAGAT